MASRIYHLAPASSLRRSLRAGVVRPPQLEPEGFVHCAPREVVCSVARDYFAGLTEPLLLLEIDPDRLGASLCWEAPAPRPGGGTRHLREAPCFPHVYGPIELAAIVGVGRLRREGPGFRWPDRMLDLDRALAELEGPGPPPSDAC